MPRHSATSAMLFALCGFSILSIGDAVVKSMAGQWPGSAIATLRYLFGTIGLAGIVAAKHGRAGFTMVKPWLQLGRGAGVAIATICFFAAVMAMPLADATAILFTSPMITAILSALFLDERASRGMWAATAVAFAGVLVILRPNVLELGPAAFYPLGAACGMAMLVIFNRQAAGAAPVLVMQLLLSIVATALLIPVTALLHESGLAGFHVGTPPLSVVLKCLLVSCSATVAHLLIYQATVRASATLVAPMTYVQLLVAALLGWAAFGNAPDLPMLLGAALIVGAGLWLWRMQAGRLAAGP